jgi:hypothetical protein
MRTHVVYYKVTVVSVEPTAFKRKAIDMEEADSPNCWQCSTAFQHVTPQNRTEQP